MVLIKDESHNERFKSEKKIEFRKLLTGNSKNQIRKQYQNAETKFD
jgi:hypothetical protein